MPIKIKNSSKLTSEKRKKETKAGKEAYGTKAIKQDLKWIMKAYAFLENITTSTTINDVGLDGSTLRVLRGSRSVKDKVIKKWIEKEFNDHTTCEKNFKKRHSYIVGSLQEELLKNKVKYMKLKRVPWTVCAKIADLILFHGVSHSPALQKYFRINGNLPLDKYTLIAIKKLFDVFEYEPRKSVRELLNEESNLSMGSIYKYTNWKKINEKKLYYDLQDDIKKLLMKINVKGLNSFHLDRFAWRNGLIAEM